MDSPPPSSPQLPTTEGQNYCLRWNNHKSNFVEALGALIKDKSYVDCTIVVDEQVQFKAHRLVLAANSSYLQSLLLDVPMDHCCIIFPGVKAFEMGALLEYMYTGEVSVAHCQIPKIMRIAEELEVKGLVVDMADLKDKLSNENAELVSGNPHVSSMSTTAHGNLLELLSSSASTLVDAIAAVPNGSKDYTDDQLNFSSISSIISPSAATSTSAKRNVEQLHSLYTESSFEDDSSDAKFNFANNFIDNAAHQKPEWKRYKQYTRKDIMSAIQCVRDGMSALQAARKFGVPSRTLYDKVKKMGITNGRPMNRTKKHRPSNIESSAAFPHIHDYSQSESLLSSFHDDCDEGGVKLSDLYHNQHLMSLPIPQLSAPPIDHGF